MTRAPARSKLRLRVVRLLTLATILGVLGWYVREHWSDFRQLELTNTPLLPVVVLLMVTNVYAIGQLFEASIEPHGVTLTRDEAFGLSVLTRFGNHVSPGYAGTLIRATYIKKNYGVSYARFSSSFVLSSLMQFLISGIAATLVYFTRGSTAGAPKAVVLISAVVVLLLLLLVVPLGPVVRTTARVRTHFRSKIVDRVGEAIEQFAVVRSDPSLLLRMVLWMLLALGSSTLVLETLFVVLGQNIDLFSALFISALGGWSILFSITPASIGVREGLMALGATLIGVEVPHVLGAALLIRVLMFVSVSTLSLYYAPKLLDTTLVRLADVRRQDAADTAEV